MGKLFSIVGMSGKDSFFFLFFFVVSNLCPMHARVCSRCARVCSRSARRVMKSQKTYFFSVRFARIAIE